MRTCKNIVNFSKPFVLNGLDEVLPPGGYITETDEELLEGLSFLAYRRISTRIHLQPDSDNIGRSRTLIIDPKELDTALLLDKLTNSVSIDSNTVQAPIEKP